MDYNLDKKILFNDKYKTWYMSDYRWSLQEQDDEGKKIGSDLIPWPWTLFFTASELRYDYLIESDKYSNEGGLIQEEEIITGILHSGICRNGKRMEDEVEYSMFGTNRVLKYFDLKIQKIKDAGDDKCFLWGRVSSTSEHDYRLVTDDDIVEINLHLSNERFDKVVELIKGRNIDILEVFLGGVLGFYSESSLSIATSSIKILADSECHKIIAPENCEIEPFRLGDVGDFSIRMIQRNKKTQNKTYKVSILINSLKSKIMRVKIRVKIKREVRIHQSWLNLTVM